MDNKKIKRFNKNEITDQEFELICEYVRLRHKSGISQRELADATELAQSTIARFERNMHSASLSTFIKLLDTMGYKLEITKK